MNSTAGAIRQSCSSIARSAGEPLYGTAPVAQSWILLEQPGPWGPDALFESNLDPRFSGELTKRTTRLGCRVMLIRRRSGRYESSEVTCFLAASGAAGVWMEKIRLGNPSDLLDCELESVLHPEPPGIGTRADEAYLVCTHGRRDPCCAEYGRALLNSLTAIEAPIWESSHQGGHRFAANMACFPHGLFYGRVGRDDGPAIIEAHRRGEIYLPHYRGRSAYDSIVQSAEFLVRLETGFATIDGLTVERVSQREGRALVTFRTGSATHTVELELTTGDPRPESCNKPKLTKPEIWARVS
ncbi:MAG: sucrase ferredoxin [Actinomycetota bacterium]